MGDNTVLLTSENSAEFYAKALDIAQPAPVEEAPETASVEQEAAPAPAVEATPEETAHEESADDTTEQKDRKKHELNERMRKLTSDRKAALERAEAAERKAAELEMKLNPPAPQENPGKPRLEQFGDIAQYSQALEAWAEQNALFKREREETQRREIETRQKVVTTWHAKQEEARAQILDYDEVIAASSITVSDQVRDAIVESDVGPKLLHYLATNPEVGEKLAGMSVISSLREIGKIEARLSEGTPVITTKLGGIKAELSKAPPPPRPLKGANAPVQVPVDANGNFVGSYKQFKELDAAGKLG